MVLVYLAICALVRLLRRPVPFDDAVTAEYEVPGELLERMRRG